MKEKVLELLKLQTEILDLQKNEKMSEVIEKQEQVNLILKEMSEEQEDKQEDKKEEPENVEKKENEDEQEENREDNQEEQKEDLEKKEIAKNFNDLFKQIEELKSELLEKTELVNQRLEQIEKTSGSSNQLKENIKKSDNPLSDIF
jgi:hypothetical protein